VDGVTGGVKTSKQYWPGAITNFQQMDSTWTVRHAGHRAYKGNSLCLAGCIIRGHKDWVCRYGYVKNQQSMFSSSQKGMLPLHRYALPFSAVQDVCSHANWASWIADVQYLQPSFSVASESHQGVAAQYSHITSVSKGIVFGDLPRGRWIGDIQDLQTTPVVCDIGVDTVQRDAESLPIGVELAHSLRLTGITHVKHL